MFKIKNRLNKEEKSDIRMILQEIKDIYRDFYITKNNLRLFIQENSDLLFDNLNKGDKIIYSEKEGIILAVGWSDKASRKYIKILAKNKTSADKLIKNLIWNLEEDLWAKIKKNNPLNKILQKNGFKFVGNRGREILLCKKYKEKIGK